MYSRIINPSNQKSVRVNSVLGKRILRKYLSVLVGGSDAAAAAGPTSPSPTAEYTFEAIDEATSVSEALNMLDIAIAPNIESSIYQYMRSKVSGRRDFFVLESKTVDLPELIPLGGGMENAGIYIACKDINLINFTRKLLQQAWEKIGDGDWVDELRPSTARRLGVHIQKKFTTKVEADVEEIKAFCKSFMGDDAAGSLDAVKSLQKLIDFTLVLAKVVRGEKTEIHRILNKITRREYSNSNHCDYILKVIITSNLAEEKKIKSEALIMKYAGQIGISRHLYKMVYYKPGEEDDDEADAGASTKGEKKIWFILMGKSRGVELEAARGFGVRAGTQLAKKIDTMHAGGILHGDLHLGNIMYYSSGGDMDSDTTPFIDIIDFGNSLRYTLPISDEDRSILTLETLKFIFIDITASIRWTRLEDPTGSAPNTTPGYRSAVVTLLEQLNTQAKTLVISGDDDDDADDWLKKWHKFNDGRSAKDIVNAMAKGERADSEIWTFREEVEVGWDILFPGIYT